MEDKTIVELYWERDENAITETAAKYGRYCYAIAFNILSDAEDAKESVNDAYLNAWNSMPPHRPAFLSTFMGKITRFVSLKKWRERRTQKRGGGNVDLAFEELSDCIPANTMPDAELESKELAKMINAFLDELPVHEQKVFICRYWYFDSVSAISKQFGFSESKVKSMLHRTRKKLRSKLSEEGVIIENRYIDGCHW